MTSCPWQAGVPHPVPLRIRQVIINTVPQLNGRPCRNPSLELYINGKLGTFRAPSIIFQDDNHIVFDLHDRLALGDVQMRLIHGPEDATLANLTYNTGFMLPGLIRLQASDLERPLLDKPIRYSGDFSIDLVLNQDHDDLGQASNAIDLVNGSSSTIPSVNTETAPISLLTYTAPVASSSSLARCLLKLSHLLSQLSDGHAARALEMQGYRRFMARLALQLTHNDIYLAHELLNQIRTNGILDRVEAELQAISRKRWARRSMLSQMAVAKLEGSLSIASMSPTRDHLPFDKELNKDMDHLMPPLDPVSPKAALALKDSIVEASAPIVPSQGVQENGAQEVQSPIAAQSAKAKPNIPPPPPPPPGKAGTLAKKGVPPPPPPPLRNAARSMSSSGSSGSGSQELEEEDTDVPRPIVKTSLHWQELVHANQIKNTVWSELLASNPTSPLRDDQLRTIYPNIQVHKFEELFCVVQGPLGASNAQDGLNKAAVSSTALAGRPKSPQATSKLDLRRANNVGIGLSRFYKRLNDKEIFEAITGLRGATLSMDDLLTLKPLMPTREECKMFEGEPVLDSNALGQSERFLRQMASEPRIPWMIDLLIYERQFKGELEALSDKATLFIEVLGKLRESTELKILLKAVLELGNLTNYEYGRRGASSRRASLSRALGFRIDTLTRLNEVYSVDKKSTLLDYLVTILHDSNRECLVALLTQLGPDLKVATQLGEVGVLSVEFNLLKQDFVRLTQTEAVDASEATKQGRRGKGRPPPPTPIHE